MNSPRGYARPDVDGEINKIRLSNSKRRLESLSTGERKFPVRQRRAEISEANCGRAPVHPGRRSRPLAATLSEAFGQLLLHKSPSPHARRQVAFSSQLVVGDGYRPARDPILLRQVASRRKASSGRKTAVQNRAAQFPIQPSL